MTGPLDKPIMITTFADRFAKKKREQIRSLREIAPKIKEKNAPTKTALPWLKLARFGTRTTRAGCLRHDANVEEIAGVEIDYDGEKMPMREAARIFQQAGVAAFLYTSPSNTPAKPRWRGLFALSAPMPPGERKRFVARLNGLLGGILRADSFTLSQSYYYGSADDNLNAAHEVILVEGRYLDECVELDAGAIYPGKDRDPTRSADLARLAHKIRLVDRGTFEDFCEAVDADPVLSDLRESDPYREEDRQLHRAWDLIPPPPEYDDVFDRLPSTGLQFLSPDECVAQPPQDYIVKGLIAPFNVSCIFGMSGFGKSALAPYFAYHITRGGDPIFGLRVKPGPALYIAAEDGHGMVNRIAALRRRFPNAPEFCLVIGISDLLADGPDRKAILAKIAEMRPTTVWIDTLAMAFADLDEIDNKEMNRVVKVCREFTIYGAAVIVIHHPPKAEGSKTPRGGGAFYGALDMAMQLMEKTEDGVVRAKLTKNRNGPCDLDIAFRLDVEELGIDTDGDAITAVIAQPIAAPIMGKTKLRDGEREALKILRELREQSETVSGKDFRRVCKEKGTISTSENPDTVKHAINRALLGLIRKGYAKKLPSGHLQLSEDINIDQVFNTIRDNRDNAGHERDMSPDKKRDGRDISL
jgi:hypothetical protein